MPAERIHRNSVQQLRWEEMCELKKELKFLRDRYGIRLRVGRRNKTDLDDVVFERWGFLPIELVDALILRQELALYPPVFIRSCAINQFRFVKTLSLKDHTYFQGSRDVNGVASSKGPVYIADHYNIGISYQITHHEIFHRAGQESPKLGPGERKRQRLKKWKRLNELPYLHRQYWKMSEQEQEQLPFKGFACPYGRVNIWEDRATVAELLMTEPDSLGKRIAGDKILATKLSMIRSDLNRWSGGRMNESYFRDLARGMVDENYWSKVP